MTKKYKILFFTVFALIFIIGTLFWNYLFSNKKENGINQEIKEKRYAEIYESMKNAIKWEFDATFVIRDEWNCSRYPYTWGTRAEFLISNGYLKKADLLDVDGKTYCDARYDTYVDIVGDSCNPGYHIYIKCQDYETPGYVEHCDLLPGKCNTPQVSGNLENHRGDRVYFYTTTDDYIVYTKSAGVSYNYIVYTLQSFDSNGVSDNRGNFVKLVFENDSQAKEFADVENKKQNKTGYISMDNVVYLNNATNFTYDFEPGRSFNYTRASLVEFLSEKTFLYDKASFDDYYISKP